MNQTNPRFLYPQYIYTIDGNLQSFSKADIAEAKDFAEKHLPKYKTNDQLHPDILKHWEYLVSTSLEQIYKDCEFMYRHKMGEHIINLNIAHKAKIAECEANLAVGYVWAANNK